MSTSFLALLGVCGFIIGVALSFYFARAADRLRQEYRSSVDSRSSSIADPEYRRLVDRRVWSSRAARALAVFGAALVIGAVVAVQIRS